VPTDRWLRIEAAYHRARGLTAEARSRVLEHTCGSDLEMREQIEVLLQHDADPDGILSPMDVDLDRSAAGGAATTGTRAGSYEILEPIGAGGMGEVYRARDTTLHRDVALKFLSGHRAADGEGGTRLIQEAQTLAALNHPNVAQIHGLGKSAVGDFIIMELVEGETLSHRLRRAPLAVDTALEIARDLASALEAAHDKGVIHRDLKPADVMVNREGQVKILDFGVAKAFKPSIALKKILPLARHPATRWTGRSSGR
jgi:eukaryotic-like serine/threonine-protein kinase